ncbi:M56 family metallopeptidase [uncultured Rikenella sp.]|uniref:M56 family metallopeptidase n=1 Tax=uncultured Rikenella sp. TaxID=368003 RepID=UPI00260C61D9|nr:M56 family metallopeptidase [uncultured Rikenella sp.]
MFSQGYWIDALLCTSALWLFYAFVLHRRIPLGAARSCLLGLFPVGLSLPLLRIPLLPAREVAETVFVDTTGFPVPETMEIPAAAVPAPMEWKFWLAVLYGAGVVLFVALQAIGIGRVMRQIRHTRVGEVLFSDKVAGAYSVFGRIFVDRRFERSPMLDSILAHERSHIAYGHSFDLLWMNLWRAVLWFHPAAWHCGRLIREIHEFQADRAVLREGNAVGPYIDLLIDTEAGIYPGTANALCYSLTKKRLKMMTPRANRSRLGGYLRLAALPLLVGALLGAFSLTAKASDPVSSQPQPDETALPTADTLDSKTVFEEPVEVHYLDGRKIQEPEFDTLRELLAEAKTMIKDGRSLNSETPQKQSADSAAGTKIHQVGEIITVRVTPKADTSKVPPIYIVDGVECLKQEVEKLDSEEFESITVLKGETAIRAYGERARGGVISITTKNAKNSSGRYAVRTASTNEIDKLKQEKISVLSNSGDGAPALALSQGSLIIQPYNQRDKNSATNYKNGNVTVYLSKKEQEEGVTVATKLLKDCPERFYLDSENNWVRNRKPVKVILHREAVPTKTSTPKRHSRVIPDSVLSKELPGSSYQRIED